LDKKEFDDLQLVRASPQRVEEYRANEQRMARSKLDRVQTEQVRNQKTSGIGLGLEY
jgi:hypothetical protein